MWCRLYPTPCVLVDGRHHSGPGLDPLRLCTVRCCVGQSSGHSTVGHGMLSLHGCITGTCNIATIVGCDGRSCMS